MADHRIKEQARTLQALLARLLDPPMDTETHPLPDVELSPREIKVLLLLGDRSEMMMTDLASALHAPLSTVTRIVDRLEKKRMVARFRSDQDRRIVIVKEAEKGRALHNAIRSTQFAMSERMLRPLSNGEREILLELMAKLVRDLNS